MEYVIGMAAAFIGIMAVFSLAHLFSKKDTTTPKLLEHWSHANILAGRRAVALERIATALENQQGHA